MKLQEALKNIERIEASVDASIPWSVKRTGIKPALFGTQIVLTDSDKADWISLEEARVVAAWLVDSLGGTVKWPKT